MTTFSERYGYIPNKSELHQFEGMDERLRTAIWNFIWAHYLSNQYSAITNKVLGSIWTNVLGEPHDDLISPLGDFDTSRAKQLVRTAFFDTSWHMVYTILEDTISVRASGATIDNLNTMLSKEGSAYRFVGGAVAPITSDSELTEVSNATQHPAPFDVASQHIRQALDHLSDRSSPDARNAIKEAITAVESAVKVASGDSKADIEKGLKKLGLHSQLEHAWKNLYNWTSYEGGVRHGKDAMSQVGLAEARYMVVACSAFVNYLVAKSNEEGNN